MISDHSKIKQLPITGCDVVTARTRAIYKVQTEKLAKQLKQSFAFHYDPGEKIKLSTKLINIPNNIQPGS